MQGQKNEYMRAEGFLTKIQKPARYTGGEYGQCAKDKSRVDVRFAFCFPDLYEIGMSHLGLRILYGLLNDMEGVWCERAFSVWPDMEEQMRTRGIKLYGLESGDALDSFDILGFTLQYELCYTNVLNMLDMAGLPVLAKDRTDAHPLIIAGGPCTCNPEPVAEFFDLFVVGEGEEVTPELVSLYRAYKKAGKGKKEFLRAAAEIGGVYVPSLYEVEYHDDGTIDRIVPQDGAPAKITKRIVKDLDTAYFPKTMIVPSIEVIHDRVMTEVFRGCIRGCRFCQAGHMTRPVREKSADTVVRQTIEQLAFSGCDEVSLTSLSTSDYRHLAEACDKLLGYCEPRQISLSLPSLRADNFSMDLMKRVQKVRRSGLTFAPEAGTQRLRDVINKNLTEEDIQNACANAFRGGWSGVKLYFMLGLPTETEEDIRGIAEMSDRLVYNWRQNSPRRDRGLKLTVSTSSFVPKPFTPFQWVGQNTRPQLEEKIALLRSCIKARAVTYNWHDPRVSCLEGVFARGDRRLGKAILEAWKRGARFDGWDELYSYERWLEVFKDQNIDPEFYAVRERGGQEALPWAHIDCGVTTGFLYRSYEAAMRGETAPECTKGCAGCGANAMTGGKCDV